MVGLRNPTHSASDEVIVAGELAKEVLQYSDWLVTTINESIPDASWTQPPHHPPLARAATDATDEDYHNLVNTVQRHTRCSTAYCLCRKPPSQELKCRFGLPT